VGDELTTRRDDSGKEIFGIEGAARYHPNLGPDVCCTAT
jgi:hypothetical protein